MSQFNAREPICSRREGALSLLIRSRSHDLGGFCVRRVLPSPERRMVGPFIFVDEMGPADFAKGEGIDVRPHPHIGLATVTWLFEGEILHRDSLGYEQRIRPGAVNLMTAGRGIVHSERTHPDLRASGQRLHGLQIWMALPDDLQECEPAFEHIAADRIPAFEHQRVRGSVVIGAYEGTESPVDFPAQALYLVAELDSGATFAMPEDVAERAVYVVDGEATVGGCRLGPGDMGVFAPGPAHLVSDAGARVAIFGGESFRRRHIWWNFVHTDRRRIEQAKADWREGRFDDVPGDDEFIPLPSG